MQYICLILLCFLFFIVPNNSSGTEIATEVLTLKQCVEIAFKKSPELAFAKANKEEKRAIWTGSKKDLYPTLFADYNYLNQPGSSRSGFFDVPNNLYSYAFTVEQPLFKGRALVTTVKINELEHKFSVSAYKQAQSDLLLTIHEAYFEVLKAQKLENEAEQSVLRLESQLNDAKSFFEAGTIPKNDLLQSEVELAQSKFVFIKAKNRTKLARSVLNVLMKQPADKSLAIKDTFSYIPGQIAWENVLDTAMSSRPEIVQGELKIKQAEKNIILTRAEYLPSITLSATYEKQGDDPFADEFPFGPSEIKTARAMAEWRLWSWGQSRDKVFAAKRQVKKAQETFSQLVDTITIQLRQAFLNLQEAEENIAVTEKAVEQAEENYRINQERYQAQLSTTTDLLDAETLLTRARVSYYNAVYDYNIALAAVDWASGVLVQKYLL